MQYPRLTVITPSYNQGEFLEETIRSVLDQQYPNLEYFVFDGGSSDQSVEIIRKYASYLAYWVSEKDRGQSHAINKGIERSSGEIITWLNSDDYYFPGVLEKVAQAWADHPQAGLVIGNGALVDRQGSRIRRFSQSLRFDYQALLRGSNYILQPATFINANALRQHGGLLDESYHYAMDLELWLRLGDLYPVVTIDEELAAYRWYSNVKTASGGLKRWIEMWHIMRKYSQAELTPGLLVEFFNVLQEPQVVADLGLPAVGQFAQKSFWAFYKAMQAALDTTDCIPNRNGGVMFKPKPVPSPLTPLPGGEGEEPSPLAPLPGGEGKMPSPLNPLPLGEGRVRGNRAQRNGDMHIDIVLPEGHSWFVREGYVEALRSQGKLGQVFYVPSWKDDDPRSTALYAYLGNPQADAIFLMDSLWHAQQLHQGPAWQERWARCQMTKILFSFECMNNPTIQKNPEWRAATQRALDNALPLVDAVVFAHEIDQPVFERYHKPVLWQPFAVDEGLFSDKVNYFDRRPRAFFKGKTPQFYGEQSCYRQRRVLVKRLKEHPLLVDVYDNYDEASGSTWERNRRFIAEMSAYQVVLGLPSLSPTMVVRPFEALLSGCVFFQNKILGERSQRLFQDGLHLFYYDPDDPDEFLRKIEMVLDDPELGQVVARSGYEEVLSKHTIRHRVQEALDWMEGGLDQRSSECGRHKNDDARGVAGELGVRGDRAIELGVRKTETTQKRVVIDGVIFQLQQKRPAGIYRLWQSLLGELVSAGLAGECLLLDRGGTAPAIPGLRTKLIREYDYRYFEDDALMLQEICNSEKAELFLSTYYSFPENTHSAIMLYDMIPELSGEDLSNPEWRAKTAAIERAAAYFAISHSTANDFCKLYPQHDDRQVYLTPCGVTAEFRQHSQAEIAAFRQRYGLEKPYFMLVGSRMKYKNAMLFFRAFALLPNRGELEIVCTGGAEELERIFTPYLGEARCQVLFLDNSQLSTALSGALALVYPSMYEGFGLPVLEAMQSGCPVITCHNSSLPEVAGEAAVYVDEHDVAQMQEALQALQQPEQHSALVAKGFENVQRFSWARTALKFAGHVQEMLAAIQGKPLHPTGLLYTGGRFLYGLRQSEQYIELAQALERTRRMYTGWLSLDLGKIEQAEQAIARMPAAVFRLLQDTLAQAPNGDAFLYYWYGLALEQRALPAQALDAYMVALKRHDWAAGYRWRIGFRAAGAAFSLQRLALVKQLLSQIVLTEFPVYEAALRLLRACEQPAPETQQTAPQSAAPQSAAPQSAAPNPATPATVIADKQVDKQPLVTAIVSTYNSARFLEGCLEDLEAQTIAERLEIIVVNSGSQQSEGRIVRAYQRRYKNIVYMHTQERETVYAAWNRAIQAANGKYLTNANADDRHHPRAFEIMSSILEGKPEIDVIYADCAVTSKENTALQRGPLSGRFRWPEFDRRLLFQVCMVGPQPMWRRSLHDKFGLFDAEMKSAGDYEFWLRISRQARFFHLPQVLGLYYESPTSIEHRAPEQSLYEAEAARQRYWLAGDGLRPQPGGMFLERFEPVPGLVYPLVSVILPTYNRPEELEKALRSITSQTYPNLEVIVVNDGGQDVCAIVKGFEGRLPVRYLAHETNRGAGAARNTAMRLAQGKYFAFLDDDDCYFPVHLMALVNELEQRPRLAAAYSDALQISLVQGSGGKPARNRVSGQEVVFSVDFSQDELLARNYIPNLCLLARADAVRKVGHFDESLPALEDWEWLIRLSQAGSFSHLPLVTAQYVVRENVASRNILSLRQVRSLYQSIYMKHRSMGSQAARSLQRQVYQLKIGSDLQADLPELFAAAPAAPALHAPGPAEPPSAGASRAAALLERLLEAEDLLQALQANQDQFDADLLSLVQSNAAAARADGDVDLADGLADLAEYIVAVIAVQGVEVL